MNDNCHFVCHLHMKAGVQIFIQDTEGSIPPFHSDEVICFLQKYPVSLLTYLEYLVGELKSKVGAKPLACMFNAIIL